MKAGDVMDELAEAGRAIPSLQGRTYAYPAGSITPPAAIVPFPAFDYDRTMGRGADRMTINYIVLVAPITDRSSRDRVLDYLDGDGAESVKQALEAHTYTALDSVRVTRGEVADYKLGDIDYLAVVFPLDVIGSGTS